MKYLSLTLLLALATQSTYAKDCDHVQDIERTVAIENAAELIVEAGAGSLQIKGEKDRTDLLIKARACASEKELLAQMEVRAMVESNSVNIRTIFPDRDEYGDNFSAMIDLELFVPATMKLDVADSSGPAEVSNVASLEMMDSSGSLEIKKIAGDLSVIDSSGELNIEKVGGEIEITDSSGRISVEDAGQSVVVLADSSGGIEVKNVKNDVLIKRDSSSGIDVENVGGNFTVERDSSGGIDYENVAGKVDIPSKTHAH